MLVILYYVDKFVSIWQPRYSHSTKECVRFGRPQTFMSGQPPFVTHRAWKNALLLGDKWQAQTAHATRRQTHTIKLVWYQSREEHIMKQWTYYMACTCTCTYRTIKPVDTEHCVRQPPQVSTATYVVQASCGKKHSIHCNCIPCSLKAKLD